MKRLSTVLVLVGVLTFGVAGSSPVQAFNRASDMAIVLAGMNHARANAGLRPLVENASLDATATWRSEDMLRDGCFSHIICDTDDYVWPYIKVPFTYGGENITWNTYPDSLSASAALQGWLNSPGHRANILGRYTLVGIGVAYQASTHKRMFTTVFIVPKGTARPAPAPVHKSAPKPKPTPPATDTSS